MVPSFLSAPSSSQGMQYNGFAFAVQKGVEDPCGITGVNYSYSLQQPLHSYSDWISPLKGLI